MDEPITIIKCPSCNRAWSYPWPSHCPSCGSELPQSAIPVGADLPSPMDKQMKSPPQRKGQQGSKPRKAEGDAK